MTLCIQFAVWCRTTTGKDHERPISRASRAANRRMPRLGLGRPRWRPDAVLGTRRTAVQPTATTSTGIRATVPVNIVQQSPEEGWLGRWPTARLRPRARQAASRGRVQHQSTQVELRCGNEIRQARSPRYRHSLHSAAAWRPTSGSTPRAYEHRLGDRAKKTLGRNRVRFRPKACSWFQFQLHWYPS